MNEYEISSHVYKWSREDTPNLYVAAAALFGLMSWTNGNSDGWAYWKKPSTAARRLMELLDAGSRRDRDSRTTEVDATYDELKKALTPVKAFLTRRGVDHGILAP